MGGPMSDYGLGKMTHCEYETQASWYWGQHVGRKGESSLAERIRPVLDWSGEALRRTWCSTTRLGLSPGGCQPVG
jgi:hypothetical protein